jgi:hypothetical protein
MFRERFSIRLKEIVIIVNEHLSPQDKSSFTRLLEEWDRKSLFENSGPKFITLASGGGLASSVGVSSSSSSSGSSSQIYVPDSRPISLTSSRYGLCSALFCYLYLIMGLFYFILYLCILANLYGV